MIILDILASLWWIWIPALLIWLIVRSSKSTPNQDQAIQSQLQMRDVAWHEYIESFRSSVKTKAEKKLIQALLERKSAEELYTAPPATPLLNEAPEPEVAQQPTYQAAPAYAATQPAVQVQRDPLDGTLLLLYFGAFLLVASAGLFVALSTLDGSLRTIVVAITASLLYIGGLWLHKNNKKLSEAGISFAGTGMMIAPLTGVAWYNLVADQSNGALISLVTSIVCFALYTHAVFKLQNSLVSYLLIGSFISSIESMVLTISLPSYALAWGLILAGLALQIFARRPDGPKQLSQASDASAQLLVPLSILGSIVTLPSFGSMQLAVTLALSGAYYTLLCVQQPSRRVTMSAAAQISFIAAIANTTFAVFDSLLITGLCLVIIALLYSLAIAITKVATNATHSLVAIGSLTSLTAILLTITDGWSLVISLGVTTLFSLIVWLRTAEETALDAAGLILIGLPFAVGQYALSEHLNVDKQLLLSAISTLILGSLVIATCKRPLLEKFYISSTAMYLFSSAILVIVGLIAGFEQLLVTCGALALSCILLRKISKESGWWVICGVILLIPIAHSLLSFGIDDGRFSLAVGIGLLGNALISLQTRDSVVRWMVVGCILLAPLAVGGGGLGLHWAEAGYAGGYLLAMGGCVLARAIARGKLLLSSKVPISSYAKEASEAYVFGYIVAAILSAWISLYDDHSRLVTTAILCVLSITLLYVSFRVESKQEVVALLPVLLQGVLFSAMRPDISDSLTVGGVALSSTLLAVMLYSCVIAFWRPNQTTKSLLDTSLVTSYIGPALILVHSSDVSLLMPASLMIAGCLTIYHNRLRVQIEKELSIGVVIISIHWLLYLLGVHNLHIHTHLLALFFAGLAMWRSSLNDQTGSAGYVQALYYTASVPLALQALGGQSGEIYGLLLIVQQVFFMLVGTMLNQRFLLKAGLWASLAAILYQLRGLGWAFLTLLALILIGVAVYRLQKHQDE